MRCNICPEYLWYIIAIITTEVLHLSHSGRVDVSIHTDTIDLDSISEVMNCELEHGSPLCMSHSMVSFILSISGRDDEHSFCDGIEEFSDDSGF
jgi:hypothetical protein